MRVELSIYISPTRGGKRHNSGQCENLWKCSKIRRLNISEMLKIEKIVPDYWLGTQKSVFTSGNLFYPVSNSILPEEGVLRRCSENASGGRWTWNPPKHTWIQIPKT